MVKFKFPGRPSKIVQRNLVSAYSVVLPTSDTSSISEDFCYGLTVFHECFGEDEEGDSFQGFNNDEVEDALLRKKKLERDITQEIISRGLRIPIIPLTRVELRDNKIVEIPTVSKSINIDKKPTKESIFKPKVKEKKKSNKFSILNKRILNRYHPKIQFRHNFKTLNKNSLIRFKHKSLSANYLSDRYCRKFILPTRSLHSSRVIKPNKRFLDHDRKLHERKLKQKDIYNFDGNSSDSSSDCEKQHKTDPPSKVIIREARLNITTETTITGPFSAKKFVSDDKKSRSGVITCGICGSVRFYKYVLQTRKFGIYSCESCRRFILRMIKYSKELNSEVLTCKAVEGVGKCVILPVLSNEAKETSDDSVSSKNSRCEACLLRLCLEKYIMPIEIKKLLTCLIPEEIKSNFLNSLSPDFKKSLPALNDSLNGFSETVSNIYSNEKLRKRLNTHNYLKNPRCFKKTESKFLHRRITLRQKTNFKNKPVEENGRKGNFVEKEPYLPRGPRIKHVCRSASSVLKTSTTSDKDFDDSPCNLSEADCAKNLRKSGEIKVSEKSCQMTKIRQCDDSVPNVENSTETESTKQIETHFGARTLQDFSKDSSDDSDENEDKLISTDFWEPYDPDEVYKTGFPLISSEALNVRALCFLCGSAGIEKLLYCVSCCEPYHWYCAEGPSAFREESELEKCRVNWVCRKCKVCSTCGERDSRTLISCQRCKNSFHTECLTNKALNKRLFKSDRPWVCPACLKCKSCNSNSVFTYLGNIPLCSQCFKLRQKGSFCPLCQRCYQDDDYNVKMMECGICEKWIHAKCEGISHEKYQILSFLPDTIEFVCRLCCNVPPAQWWLAVEDELKAGFFGILKCLCKNKKINDLFKESPRKDMCRCRKNKKRSASLSDDSDSCVDVDFELKTTSSDSSFCADKHDSGVDDIKENDMFSNSKPFLKGDPDQLCSFCSYNSETRNKINRDLLSIKAKVHNNQFSTLSGFHQELENVILNVGDGELMKIYRDSLKKFFPWFDPDCIESDDNRDDILFESNTDCCTAIVDSSNQDAGTEEEYSRLRELMNNDEFSYDAFKVLDVRKCNLCKGMGEAIPSEGGRLIYCGRNEWVHSNCALWSSEVFEEIDGSLQNVHSAISRGRQIRCNVCDKKGASVGCCYKNCTQTYHFLCAKKASCIFLQNRTIYCQSHDTQEVTLPFLNCEKDFEILRPVYIEMDRKKKKMDCHTNVRLRIGSLHVENLGKIDPHLSDNPKYIIPIYYRCSRLFWSVSKPWKIIQYHVQIKLRYSYEPVKCSTEMNYTVDHSATNSDDEIVEHVLKELVNKVCSKEDDFFPGMQNGNDLLSPELQEAIYKDFPNDLLDDKTLQDIWNDYDGLNETECSAEKNQMKKFSKAEVKTEKDKKIKKVNEVETNERKWEEKKINTNGKYLRDKNDFKDAVKKNHLSGFYNDIKSKTKRKIDFENTSLTNAKKILLDGNYIGNDFYQEADRNFKPPYVQSYENILQLDGMVDIIDEEPVKCLRCHRTYRTTLSFDRHLEICNLDFNDYMISSCESDTSSEEEKFNSCSKPLPKKDFRDAYDTQKSNNVYPQVAKSPAVNPAFSSDACNNIGQNTIYTYSSVQENRTTSNQLENVGMQTFVQNIKQESITVATQPSVQDTMKFNVVNGKIKPEIVCNNFATQFAVNNVAQTQSYQIQNVTPTYVIQQFPKSEVIPTYVTVDSAITECIQSQDNLLQQPLQLQQITTVNQPPVIQPVIPTFLVQPSVIETPTYIVNTPPSTELFAPQNNIILPNQPVLFGMETVVSNTVMSSSQFMTQSLTGDIGSSTLYSTTTTQVFQAAKPLPQPNYQSGFIVVNSPVQQPALQQIQTVVKPQPQPITPTEKYMYVQLNTPAPKIDNGPKPMITKAVKNNAIPKDKPVKVMKVRNNKPVVVPVTLSSSIKTYKNNENVSVVKVNGSKPIPNGIHPNVERPCKIEKFDVAINTSFSSPNSISSKTFIPNVNNSSPRESTEKRQKVDKCVNTDRKDLQTIKLSYSINNADENAKPTIKSWQINLSPESHVSVPPQSPKLNELVAPLSKTVLSPGNTSESVVSSPPPSKIESPVVLSLPTLTTKDDKTDSDKLFDELLRQHMLSMEKEPKLEEDPPKCKIYSKHKYKPQINPKLNSEEPKESKIIVKKKISPEKENNNKAKATETENVKNWKTASISFEVNAEDGFSYKTNNLKDLWNKIIDSVQKSRAKCKLPLLPKNAMVNAESIYSLLGFENNASKYLLEQLPDAWKCIFYKPVFHKSSIQSSKTSPLKNETGCARTEPVNSSHKHDMFGWLASRHRKPPKFMMISDSDIVNGNRRITSLNLPMAMRFRHLKETAKETVGVFRSDIHGRGLFCLRDIDPGEMVIEYAGEVIRSTLTDKRERYYTSKGIGCYMFRIDDKYVVDATMCGNAARFINHSCEPNCYSRIVDILGKKHILIFALRKIPKGEELTYDYKFPLEDDKIYCHCLSRKCRKYLN